MDRLVALEVVRLIDALAKYRVRGAICETEARLTKERIVDLLVNCDKPKT